MLRFSKLQKYELLEVQNDTENIYRLKKNNYISDLDDEEIVYIYYIQNIMAHNKIRKLKEMVNLTDNYLPTSPEH